MLSFEELERPDMENINNEIDKIYSDEEFS